MTKEQLIVELKKEYSTLTYGINDEVFEMSDQQYEETISSWADARIAKEQLKLEKETARLVKVSAYQKLGLTEEEIKALLPSPKPSA
jgi:hypothetical protein